MKTKLFSLERGKSFPIHNRGKEKETSLAIFFATKRRAEYKNIKMECLRKFPSNPRSFLSRSKPSRISLCTYKIRHKSYGGIPTSQLAGTSPDTMSIILQRATANNLLVCPSNRKNHYIDSR